MHFGDPMRRVGWVAPSLIAVAIFIGESDGAKAESRTSARRPAAATPVTSQWNHNGSLVSLVSAGGKQKIVYEAPRVGLLDAGVKPGTLLFEGQRSGHNVTGTAYQFYRTCKARGFEVSGTTSDDRKTITLKGKAPLLDMNCNVTGSREDILIFTASHTAPSEPPKDTSLAAASGNKATAPTPTPSASEAKKQATPATVPSAPPDASKATTPGTESSKVVSADSSIATNSVSAAGASAPGAAPKDKNEAPKDKKETAVPAAEKAPPSVPAQDAKQPAATQTAATTAKNSAAGNGAAPPTETAKADQSSAAPAAKAETAKSEASKSEAPKSEAPTPVNSAAAPKVEPPKDVPKDTPKDTKVAAIPEAAKAAAKTEETSVSKNAAATAVVVPPNVLPPKIEPKTEPKIEPKTETSKTEAPKTEASKTEVAKTEAPKTEVAKIETGKTPVLVESRPAQTGPPEKMMEIVLKNGRTLRIGRDVELETLARIIAQLER